MKRLLVLSLVLLAAAAVAAGYTWDPPGALGASWASHFGWLVGA
jgi:hypothetical protein